MDQYLGFKLAHLLIAIAGLGSGAAVGVLLVFFADDPAHGAFVLRTARRLLYVIVVPAYVLMLATGMWMGHLADLLDARWTEAAMNIWGFGAIFFALLLVALRRQIKLFESQGPASPPYRRAALLARCSGAAAALVILIIICFMVFKPG